jgi:ATP-binding cassette subfamily B protein
MVQWLICLRKPINTVIPSAESEAKIFARIRQSTMGATTILVAHRFSTVRQADRILVIEQGQIIEEGNHEELLHLNGTYACLFRLQAKGYLDEKQAITMASSLPVGDQDI